MLILKNVQRCQISMQDYIKHEMLILKNHLLKKC